MSIVLEANDKYGGGVKKTQEKQILARIRLAVCGVSSGSGAGRVLGSQGSALSRGTAMKLVVQGVPAESWPGGDGNAFWQRPAHRVQVSQRRSSEDVGRRLLHISIKEGAETEGKKKGRGKECYS